eukprot:97641-Rhodomonas_salina.2
MTRSANPNPTHTAIVRECEDAGQAAKRATASELKRKRKRKRGTVHRTAALGGEGGGIGALARKKRVQRACAVLPETCRHLLLHVGHASIHVRRRARA